MNFEHTYSNVFTSSPRQHPYSSSLSSSASSSSSSVFSVDATSSQSSESTSYTSSSSIHVTWDTEDPWRVSACREEAPSTVKRVLPPLQIKTNEAAVAPELRQHPRRCSSGNQRAPPALLRQSERKCQFVDCLVDSATTMVEVIWPISAPRERACQGVLPLRTFIQETLRRSRTSFSTLQVALYYLILIKAHVPKYDFTMEQLVDTPWNRALQCGRRMFLAALILASKYLQDRNYSARAWSKISGLKVCEINTNEMAFLKAVNWKLHFPEPLFDRWQHILMKYTPQQPPSPGSPFGGSNDAWKAAILRLTPELDTVDISERTFQVSAPSLRNRITPPPPLTCLANAPSAMPSPVTSIPPRVLEPTPHMPPPTPSLVRMGPLPTPSMTPQSAVSNTPAASLAGFESRRPSYGCSAMARAQREIQMSDYSNMAVDYWTKPQPSRRPSVMSSASSSSSSPESMVSDNSSRCSRASSISSISSASACAPNSVNVKLARLATLRCAGLPYALPQQQQPRYKDVFAPLGSITMEPLSAEPMSSPDFESFHITEDSLETPTRLPVRDAKPSPCKRKRGRSSVDLSLQQNVRNLLHAAEYAPCTVETPQVLPDCNVATSFLLNTPGGRTPISSFGPKALQSPARSVPERRLPVQKELGRKRFCAVEAAPRRLPFEWRELVLDA